MQRQTKGSRSGRLGLGWVVGAGAFPLCFAALLCAELRRIQSSPRQPFPRPPVTTWAVPDASSGPPRETGKTTNQPGSFRVSFIQIWDEQIQCSLAV